MLENFNIYFLIIIIMSMNMIKKIPYYENAWKGKGMGAVRDIYGGGRHVGIKSTKEILF